MPQVGTYSFPSVRFSRALEVARTIADHKGHVSIAALATALEMAEKGGGFAAIVAALRDYSLVEGRGDLTLSSIAERVLYASADDASAARAEAFFGVPLFRSMQETLGTEIPAETRLRAVVHDITRESLATINSKLPVIKGVWSDGLQTVGIRAFKSADETNAARTEVPAEPSVMPSVPDDSIFQFQMNSTFVKVAKVRADIDLVIQLLTVVRDQLPSAEQANVTFAQIAEGDGREESEAA